MISGVFVVFPPLPIPYCQHMCVGTPDSTLHFFSFHFCSLCSSDCITSLSSRSLILYLGSFNLLLAPVVNYFISEGVGGAQCKGSPRPTSDVRTHYRGSQKCLFQTDLFQKNCHTQHSACSGERVCIKISD